MRGEEFAGPCTASAVPNSAEEAVARKGLVQCASRRLPRMLAIAYG